MDKKIIFFDIDGTIYNFSTGMPKDTKEAIIQLKKNGHIPVICTGRTRCMIYEEHLEAGFEHIVAGAGTYVEIDGEERFLSELEDTKVQQVLDGFLKCNFFPIAEGKNNIYLGEDYNNISKDKLLFIDVYKQKIPEKIRSIFDDNKHISKISGAFKENCNINMMIEMFHDDYYIINHYGYLLELIPKPFNKAKGIEQMIKEMDIPWENTYAFGDSFNDIDMLEYVKYGCAMGNSDPEIKERVKYITDDFDKGGIANALKRFDLI